MPKSKMDGFASKHLWEIRYIYWEK